MRKFLVILFIVLLSVGIIILSKNSTSEKKSDNSEVSKTIENTTNFIDPHTFYDPSRNKRVEEMPEKSIPNQ